ncbi:ATP-binding protein [Marinivivus vitaminiproducens]|uniref:sensor histidine kinase n=1 Tax=Marinivivus vitaminiproducens TaxID=3035935 RepID=UPI0027AABCD4|nr:ATP-binding protein [Geminicoccaceae bacterium SCSIO 64248]
MSIRSKIIAFQLLFLGAVLLLGAVVYFAIERADYYIERVSQTHRQLEATTALSVAANRYSEQIAEMLLFGEAGRQEFEEARRDLTRSFNDFEMVTIAEIALIEDEAEREGERAELLAIRRMRSITAQMHDTALDLLQLIMRGREEDARLRYYAEIEEDQDDRLQELIDLAVADEKEEVRVIDEQTERLTRELIVIVSVTIALTLLASMGAVFMLSRALARPVARLSTGAEAIGSGQLWHRIPIEGNDELTALSQHFNKMATQLEAQRQEVMQHQALLEDKVAERTVQLEDANRRLEDLDRLRVLFLADVSHELRTPLTVLRGEAEVALRNHATTSEDYRDALAQIVDQAEHMGRLVDDLLFLTRAEADSIRFEMGRVNLQEVLEAVVEEGRVMARSQDIAIVARYPDRPVEVIADRGRLHQVALIAIDNAIKYSYRSSTVTVELAATREGAQVCIRNHGDPIPAEDLPYVFDRFYRGRQRRGKAGGSGLGLSIAKWIVEKHRGRITLVNLGQNDTELRISLSAFPAAVTDRQRSDSRILAPS